MPKMSFISNNKHRLWLSAAFTLIACSFLSGSLFAKDAGKSDLQKYMKPRVVTELDWKLLDVQFSLRNVKHWDDYGLIDSASVWRIPKTAMVGVVFTVNSDAYAKSDKGMLTKGFNSALDVFYNVAKADLPELNKAKDIHAVFINTNVNKTVGEYVNGKLEVVR